MPFFKQIWLNTDTALQLWELTEAPRDLMPSITLNAKENLQLEKLRNTKRQAEFLATRLLLRKVLPEKTISYNDSGAPFIADHSSFISVSHSNRFVCLMHSRYPCGVDIEGIESKALRIARRFLSEDELNLIQDDYPARDATLLWTVKESLFKLLKRERIDFTSQLVVHEIQNASAKRINASIVTDKGETSHTLMYDFIDQQVMTWVTDEKKLCDAHR